MKESDKILNKKDGFDAFRKAAALQQGLLQRRPKRNHSVPLERFKEKEKDKYYFRKQNGLCVSCKAQIKNRGLFIVGIVF